MMRAGRILLVQSCSSIPFFCWFAPHFNLLLWPIAMKVYFCLCQTKKNDSNTLFACPFALHFSIRPRVKVLIRLTGFTATSLWTHGGMQLAPRLGVITLQLGKCQKNDSMLGCVHQRVIDFQWFSALHVCVCVYAFCMLHVDSTVFVFYFIQISTSFCIFFVISIYDFHLTFTC